MKIEYITDKNHWNMPGNYHITELKLVNIGGKLSIYPAFLYELYYNWRGEISLFGNI